MDDLSLDAGLDMDLSDGLSLDAGGLSLTEEEASAAEQLAEMDIEQRAAEEVSEILEGFRARAGREQDRFVDATDSEHWIAVCFQTREQKEEFLSKLKLLELGDKYLDGMLVAERLGVNLESPVPGLPTLRIDRRLAELT